MNIFKQKATLFGKSLDEDQFEFTKSLLSENCKYTIGPDVLKGPEEICASYENNMIEGRKKLDKLEWGKSRIEEINEKEYYVHFTDYLTHKGISHVHRCKQKLRFDDQAAIISIKHIDNAVENKKLSSFYESAGL